MSSNLDELIKDINKNFKCNQSIKYLANILNSYYGTDWINYIIPSGKKGKKNNEYYKKCVYQNDNFDLYVISWMENSKSKIHDHAKNGCLFKVLKGELLEEKFESQKIKLKEKKILKNDQVNFISNLEGYHRIINNIKDISVSIHIYSPPNYKINSFN